MSVLVIAEAGVNHNGDPGRALELVAAAAAAGADAVKFQTFVPEALVSRHAPKAEYQTRTTDARESQLEMLRRLALAPDDFRILKSECERRGIAFLSSPFDALSAELLIDMGLPCLKLGSGELTNAPLLLQIARSGRALILSTGMSTLAEVEQALGVLAFGYGGLDGRPHSAAFAKAYAQPQLRALLQEKVSLLHCTTEYPCPFEDVNLRAMDTLREAFGLRVGFSDHTVGYAVPVAAVAHGAQIIEKHFTLDRRLPGPDHTASLEPAELAAMVTAIRQVEQALGSPDKQPAKSERKNAPIARKVLVAARAIAAGEPYTERNLTTKRAGGGIDALRYYDLLGTPARRAYSEDEPIEP